MKFRLLILLLAALTLLCGCGYWAVEEAPIQVGEPVILITPVPTDEPLL